MTDVQSLDILRELRERAGLTQADMAQRCGLRGRQSHQTAGAWERGEMRPSAQRRARFMGYLWDDLWLRNDPAQFEAVWAILVEQWGWDPIGDAEWRKHFPGTPRPGAERPDAITHAPRADEPGALPQPASPSSPPTRAPHALSLPAKNAAQTDPGRGRHPHPLRWANPVLLTAAMLVLAALLLLTRATAGLEAFFRLPGSSAGFPCVDAARAADHLVLAVAQFDEKPDRNTEDRLLEALDAYVEGNELEQYGLRVCPVLQEVPNGLDAQHLVEEGDVALLVWGRLDDVALEIGWQVMEWPLDAAMVGQWPAAQSQSFDFQTAQLDAAMTPLAGFALSHLLVLKGERSAAIRLLEMVTADDSAAPTQLRAKAYFFLGYLLMLADAPTAADWRAARAALRTGLDLAPERTDMLLNLGYVHEQLAEWDAARAAYTAAIEAGVDTASAFYNRARVHLYVDDFPAAARDAEAAIELDPTDWGFYHVLGIAQLAMGEQAAAAATYAQVRCLADPAMLSTITDQLASLAHDVPQHAAAIHATVDQLHSERDGCPTVAEGGSG